MSKRALLFPGQGSQFIGMTEDFNEQGKDTINELNSPLDIDLVNIMYNDDAVNETQYTQRDLNA